MQLAALARNETALGLRRAGSDGPPGGGLDLNPDREKQWTLGPGDELVVLASSGERRASR